MLLRLCPCFLMNRRKSATACNGRFKKRRESAVRTLVAETLVLAKTHGYVEKIEDELEQELARDIRPPPAERLNRLRREGDKIFKSKYMLLIVVILCILDCALVLGELTLDLHKVKVKLEDTELFISSAEHFADSMQHKYSELQNLTPYSIFQRVLKASIFWNISTEHSVNMANNSAPCVLINGLDNMTRDSLADDMTLLKMDKLESSEHKADLELLGTIAHAFHYCSIAILGVLMVETVLKAICAGKSFFHRKLEVFDAFIVVMSFLVDFCFIVFMPDIDTKDFVFILAILLPWRVIRVVNSLVVSVKDHEHFRLKLVYKRKKKIQSNLRETENQMQRYRTQATCLQRLCIMEGIDEWKVDHTLKTDGSVPPTPVKKKFRLFEDSPFGHGHHNRAPRFSLPSLDFHGTRFATGNIVNNSTTSVFKSKGNLPFSAFNTIKQHISKTLPNRRFSQAAVNVSNSKIANGDVKRKKLPSDDLTSMHDIIHEDKVHDSTVSSRTPSESEDEIKKHISINKDDNIPVIRGGGGGGKYMERHHSVDSDHGDQAKLMKILQDPRRRLSETAAMDRHIYPLTGFEDIRVSAKTDTDIRASDANTEASVASDELGRSLMVIPAIKPDLSYSSFEFMDTDKRNSNIAHDDDDTFELGIEDGLIKPQNNNENESAIIECESVTINPPGKMHTAECDKNKINDNNNDNHQLNSSNCTDGIPKVFIVDEVKTIIDNDFQMSNNAELRKSDTNDT